MNKNTLYLAIFAVLCVLAGVLAGAAITRHTAAPWQAHHRMDFVDKAERFMGHRQDTRAVQRRPEAGLAELITERLELSAEQKDKVGKILDKTRQQIEEIGQGLRSSISEIKKRSEEEIMGVLTPEQKKKFSALLEDLESRRCMIAPDEARGPMRRDGFGTDEDMPMHRR